MKKRLLALLLCTVIVFASAPVTPIADLFTIEASAEDRDTMLSKLNMLLVNIGDESEWKNKYTFISTIALSLVYKDAKEIAEAPDEYEDNEIQKAYEELQRVFDSLEYHTQGISVKKANDEDKNEYNVNVGDSFDVEVTLVPYDAVDKVEFETSDKAAVEVSSKGEVTIRGYSENPVTIRASSNGHSDSFILNISNPLDSVSLSRPDAEVDATKTVTLTASSKGKDSKFAPTEEVTYTWESSDESIAKVSDKGVITAIKKGQAIITVTATGKESGQVRKATATVSVRDYILITDLKPSTSSTVTMIEGETKKLTVAIYPEKATDKELTWASTSPVVAEILSSSATSTEAYAEIKANKEGKAEIVFATKDGSNKSGSFIIDVKPQIKKINISESYKVLTPDTKGERLICTIEPANAGNQFLKWSSDNDNVCKVDNSGYINPVDYGSCIITAMADDGSGVKATCKVVVARASSEITLDKTSLSLKTNDTAALKATIKPVSGDPYEDAVKWSTSNNTVVVVDVHGNVTAKGPGKANIIATALDGSGKKATCEVTVTQPVYGISFDNAEEICEKGGTITLKPTINPSNATNKNLTWSSSNPSVAAVDANGKVTGITVGKTVITVKTADGGFTATCTVNIEITPTSVTLDKNSVTLYVDPTPTSYSLVATVLPADATLKDITWSSSNPSVATVDGNGTVTAVHGGTATIIAKTVRNGRVAACTVTVIEKPKSVEITNAPDSLFYTQVYTLTASVQPATATNKNVIWKSDNEKVIKVDSLGKLTAVGEGNAEITVTTQDGELTDSCIIFVTNKTNVTGLSLNPSSLSLKKGDSYSLLATIVPSNASEKSITWKSSDTTVATVDANGKVTAKKVGNAIITATTKDGGFAKTCSVTVYQPVTGVSLNKTSLSLANGKTSTLIATVAPSDATNKNVTWSSSNANILTVSQTGVVTAKNPGTATVTVTTDDGSKVATCDVTVYVSVTGIKLSASSISVPKGQSRYLTPTISPSNATNRELTWGSSDPSIATVNSSGQITGIKTGTTTILVKTKDGNKTASCTVKVVQLATSVKLDFSSITLDAGKKKTLTASVGPSTATDKTVKWKSSNKAVVTVSSKGVITAVAGGVATISATSTDGNATVSCKVTVTQPVTGIKFSSKNINVSIGTPKTLKPTITPASATNKTVTYKSSDSKIAKVSSSGVVTGVKKGTAKITATTANGLYSATVTVNVQKPVKSVKLNKTSITIGTGKKTSVTPTVSPSSASNKNVTWKSSDYDVLSVDSKGVITAKEPGYAVVTCTTKDGGKTATCSVRVVKLVTSVKLNKKTATLESGDKLTLKATVKPSNASDKSLKWSSSDKKVAKVSSKGVVTAVSTGVATITVKTVDGSYTAKCTIYVVKKVDSVSVKSAMTLYLGETSTLKATIKPSDATDKTVTWKSSDKKVATVSSKGVVTAKKTGTAKITVTTKDGSFKATCKVSVKRAIEKLKINKTKLTLDAGKSYTLKITKTPSNATESIKWTTSNKKVATVSSKGVIKAVGRGTATITGKTEQGIKVTCKVTVKQPVTSMKISKTSAVLYLGDKLTLKANVLPTNANNQKFTWSVSSGGVVTLSKGVVTAKKLGTATVTVKSENGKTAKCVITVKQHVTGISLNKTALSLTKGEAYSLKATIKPSNASEKGYTFLSSNTAVATVDANGKVTAKAAGKATITVRSKENNKTATCTVTVIEKVTGVSLNTSAQTVYVGSSYTLKATVAPATASNKAVTWASSNASVAGVSSAGVVTALKPGTATVTVTTADGAKKASCTFTVLRKATGISISETDIMVIKGDSHTLTATVLPSDAHNKDVVWTSENPEIATVENGKVTAVEIGETTVTATSVDGSFTAVCKVRVAEPVTGVELDKEEITLYRGTSHKLTGTVSPEDAGIKDLTWESNDEQVATVDEDGNVTAVGKGETIITVTSVNGGFTDTCTVKVIIPVEEIVTDREEYFVPLGSENKIIVTVLPEDAENPEITWSSEGDEFFTLTDGTIQANEIGSGVVTITSVDNPEISKTVTVHITKAVESVELDEAAKTINKGDSFTLNATVLPEDAHNKNVTWKSSDEEVATVDENGTVTAIGKGEAVITVTTEEGEYTAECIVTVNQLVEEITFEAEEYTVGKGKTITLLPSVLPENANDSSLSWISEDEEIATVTDGVVEGIGLGTVTITAKANDESGTEKTVKVTVVQHAQELTINEEPPVLLIGESFELTATVAPEDTTDKTVLWESSAEEIATVDENGKVTAISKGEVTITATSICGNAKDEITVTVHQQVESVELDETAKTINKGDSFTLNATVLPEDAHNKNVTWKSNDEEVATVDENGTVTAIGKGEAVITVTTEDGEYTAECTVTVILAVESVKLDVSEKVLYKNESFTLNATVLPEDANNKNVTWKSSDEEVATVDENGTVTAIGKGEAVITVTTEEGEYTAFNCNCYHCS